MIGNQSTGTVPGAVIAATAHEGLQVTFNGRPARLAIIADDGTVIAAGASVAAEVEAVAVGSYRAMLKGQGHLRVLSGPVGAAA